MAEIDPRAGKLKSNHYYMSNTGRRHSFSEIDIYECDLEEIRDTYNLNDVSVKFMN